MKIPAFDLERFFAKHEFTAPYLWCTSDCESLTVKEILDWEPSSRQDLDKLWLGYTESLGHPELRATIASLYSGTSADQIMVHAGAEEAIFSFMNVTLGPGDHVIVHWPCYQSLFQVAASIGCEVTKWEGDPENNWELDVGFLQKSIKKNTKLVVLNSPHNPTGYLLPRDKFDAIIKIVDKHGVTLFMDEVYKGLEYETKSVLPSACDVSPNAVSLGVMSKAFGLAGLRIGWVATKNARVFAEMAAFKDYTTICNSAPSEFLTTLALRHRSKLIERNIGIIRANLEVLDSFFPAYPEIFDWNRPKAGCIAFPKLKNVRDAETFSNDLLARSGVLVAPGGHFGFDTSYFRIGFGRKNCPEVVARVQKYLASKERIAL